MLLGLTLWVSFVHAQSEDFDIKKSTHFIIYYKDVPTTYVNKVAREAERYYKSITNYLGFMRFEFWTWDNRCRIYIYSDREEYVKSTGAVAWSRGAVHIQNKEIVTYTMRKEFFDYVLPHEMGHIIFREVVGLNTRLPLWIDEAVALLQEKDRDLYLREAEDMVRSGFYIPISNLSRMNDYSKISPKRFYSEAASIVDFLLEEYSRSDFVDFCRDIRDGKDWQEALLKTYRFDDLKALEEAWVDYLLQ
ncbi:MAG: hypothetical protein JW869_04780 [Candidatus Omnitrophica bacterium]|nr:hypothetical protein [Candidatus Omnitrophota bacterium]